mmetsp:Transcript_5302/g.14739  ORF Transcript_5302/g.14739 Transcript_5302/m.14739 type:complete len:291 (+) Transcript_5302:52-924(+)
MEGTDQPEACVASIVELCSVVDALLATSHGEIRMTQLKERVRWFHRKRLDQHALGYRTLVELFDHTDLAAKFALEGPLNQLTLVWRRDVDLYTTTPLTTTTTTKCALTLRGMCSWPLLEGQDLVTLPNVGSYRRTRGGRLRTAAKLSSGGEQMQPSLPHLAQRAEWMLLLQRQQSLQPQQPEQQPQQELQEQQPLPPMEVQPHLSLQVFHQWQHRQQQQLQQLTMTRRCRMRRPSAANRRRGLRKAQLAIRTHVAISAASMREGSGVKMLIDAGAATCACGDASWRSRVD